MNINTQEVQKKAIDMLTEGKNMFNNAKNKAEMTEGYNKFIEGITLLNKLKQYEKDNQYAVKILSEKIKQYIEEAQRMQHTIQNTSDKPVNNNRSGGGGNKGSNTGGGDKPDEEDTESDAFKAKLKEKIVAEKPNISWDDVAGLHTAKTTLKEAIQLPRKFPEIFQGIRTPWKGILLYGPPGTGKTFLAKACASMANATFFSISSSDLISKWVGEAEKTIKALFEQAREQAPSIIFIDEIDSVVSKRTDGEQESTRRVKTEFLVQMEGVSKGTGDVLVLGATNFPWGLDPAMRRRFEKRVYIPLPDYDARFYKLKRDLRNNDYDLTEEDLKDICNQLDGYSMSDITNFLVQAAMEPLQRTRTAMTFKQVNKNGKQCWQACSPSDPQAQKIQIHTIEPELLIPCPIIKTDMYKAIQKIKKAVGPETLKQHDEFTRDFGCEG